MTVTPQQVVEAFYRMADIETPEEKKLLATLSPWPRDAPAPPSKVLVLDRMTEDQIEVALAGADMVIAGSTFSTDEEIAYAKKYLPLLGKRKGINETHTCVIIFQLATPEMNKTRDEMENHLKRFHSITSLGMDEMVFLPDLKPHLFNQNLKIAQMTWQSNIERITEMLAHEAPRPSEEEIKKMEKHHKLLLWHEIPSALMPKFKPMDNALVHDSIHIGNYVWLDGHSNLSQGGAKGEDGREVNIKVIDKATIFTADDLEGIFREFRFLSNVLDHPNLPKCVDMLHGPEKVYLVFGGPCLSSLNDLLLTMPDRRASSAASIAVFKRMAETLEFVHGHCCAHRNVSVNSVRVRFDGDELPDFKLTDFDKAVQVRNGQSTIAACGSFPAMAPEMAHGEPYIAHLADCWSAGILLLEMAGGLGSLQASLHADFGDVKASSILIEAFFLRLNCHHTALVSLGAFPNEEIITYLQRTLQPRPQNRREMTDMFKDDDPERPPFPETSP